MGNATDTPSPAAKLHRASHTNGAPAGVNHMAASATLASVPSRRIFCSNDQRLWPNACHTRPTTMPAMRKPNASRALCSCRPSDSVAKLTNQKYWPHSVRPLHTPAASTQRTSGWRNNPA